VVRAGGGEDDGVVLVARIRADGWSVENYQFPLIADERWAKSDLLQRLALVDVVTDREVWMLYSSFMRRIGPGLIWVYGPEAAAIGAGTTGGGPDIPGSPQMPSLSWKELARDLRLARHWSGHLLIHSSKDASSTGISARSVTSTGTRPPTRHHRPGPPVGFVRACAVPCGQLLIPHGQRSDPGPGGGGRDFLARSPAVPPALRFRCPRGSPPRRT
jgi:hypothetical protein